MNEPKKFGELAGFTPLFDEMVEKYGRRTALVYGRIWRRCQGVDGICFESVPHIAKGIGYSERWVRESIKTLVEAGEIFFVGVGKNNTNKYALSPDVVTRLNDEAYAWRIDSLCNMSNKDRSKTQLNDNRDFKKKLIREAEEHYHQGPNRDKRLDPYYDEALAALRNGVSIPEKPVFEN